MSWSANHPSVSGENADPRSATERDSPEKLGTPYLTVEQAADYLRVSKNYLDKLRVSGMGPPFIRLGRRKVLYRMSDLDRGRGMDLRLDIAIRALNLERSYYKAVMASTSRQEWEICLIDAWLNELLSSIRISDAHNRE